MFYPTGIVGQGRVLPNDEYAVILRKQLKKSYIVTLPAIVVFTNVGLLLFPPWGAFVSILVLFPYLIWYRVAVTRPLQRFPVAPERLTFRDASEKQAKHLGWAWHLVLFLSSIAFVAFGVFMLVKGVGSPAMAFLTVAFFGLCSIAFAYSLLQKSMHRRNGVG